MFNRASSRPSYLFMRLRSEAGEQAVFKDDKGRFTSSLPHLMRVPHVAYTSVHSSFELLFF